MKRRQNIIIFSAGESVRNRNVDYIKEQLQIRDIACFDYRSLFNQAHNLSKIALLPSLSKKIPTFDFALIIADSVDTIKLRGGEERSSMRDNVIFEIGLCVMALGVERVLLLAEKNVRIPEDLEGIGKIGVEYITFGSKQMDKAVDEVGRIIEDKANIMSKRFASQLDEIIGHINVNADLISPVFIGAAVSSAEAYFLNFIIRLLENIDKGFSSKDNPKIVYPFPNNFSVKIVMPTTVNSLTRTQIAGFYKSHGYKEYMISEAGMRGLFFYANYNESNNELVVVDVPTSITASYVVVKSVLSIDADDDYDVFAEERFATKELDVYAFALSKLLTYDVAKERLSFIKDALKKESVLKKLEDVSICVMDISK